MFDILVKHAYEHFGTPVLYGLYMWVNAEWCPDWATISYNVYVTYVCRCVFIIIMAEMAVILRGLNTSNEGDAHDQI